MTRTVLITGCSSGFGRMMAEKLARRGDTVYATMRGFDGRNSEIAGELQGLAAAEDLDLHVLELDVTSDESVDASCARMIAEAGAPDVVVNNAGQMFVGLTEAFTAEELARQLDINLVGVHRVNRAVLPAMREAGRGLLVNVSSTAGRVGVPFFSVYHASKWGLEGYSLGLRAELASSGVDVVIVEPGPFGTQLFPHAPRPVDEDGRAASYPDAVPQAFDGLQAAFDGIFADPDAPTDPELVVDAMTDLIDQEPGTRPLRTVVGVDFGVRARNDFSAERDAELIAAIGLTEFATLEQ
jgi:NAD(P)-dependent dehydrogenase (short-subunit alcohol dehydrogenase family)